MHTDVYKFKAVLKLLSKDPHSNASINVKHPRWGFDPVRNQIPLSGDDLNPYLLMHGKERI